MPPGSSRQPARPPRDTAGFFVAKDNRPTLITEAAPSLEQQHRDRVRRYTILMAARIPCLILAAVAYSLWSNPLISMAIVGVSIPLPWIAVLVANDRPPRRKDEPSRWDGRGETPTTPELHGRGTTPATAELSSETQACASETQACKQEALPGPQHPDLGL